MSKRGKAKPASEASADTGRFLKAMAGQGIEVCGAGGRQCARYFPDSRELKTLAATYPGIVFNRISVEWFNHETPHFVDDDAGCYLSVSGDPADLIKHRFMHPEWMRLSKCGRGRRRTKGFGSADIIRRKSGKYSLSYLYLDHALDLFAPAILPLYWTPPKREAQSR